MRVAVGALAIVFAAPGVKAQALPSMQPTSLPLNNAMPAPINGAAMPGTLNPNAPHSAQVSFVDGEIDVRADNSSLIQILRAISHATGLKITGGVEDQRVFGNYGPAPLSTVLATLLDGTGTNILFLAGGTDSAPSLILTPRGGGATPPSPESPVYAAYDQPTPIPQPPTQVSPATPPTAAPASVTSGPVSIAQPLNNVNGSPSNTSPTASTLPTTHSVPLDSIPTPSTTPSTSGIVDAPNPPPAASTTGTTPAGTLTPEMVYQELLKQQQKQQQSAHPSTDPSPHP